MIMYIFTTNPIISLHQKLLVVLVSGLLFPYVALGFFTDHETSPQQQFRATELQLQSVNSATTTVSESMAGEFTSTVVLTASSTAARYDVATIATSGNATLCSNLTLQATSADGVVASMPAADFATSEQEQTGTLTFVATVGSDASDLMIGSACQVTLEVSAWQANMPKDTAGYRDTTTLTATITYLESIADESLSPEPKVITQQAGDVVINEVMWMGSSVGSNDEWIELRNTTNEMIDISGWQLMNAGAANTIITLPASTTITANGFYFITNYDPASSASAVALALASSSMLVDSGVSLANTYSNNEALALLAANGATIDQTPVANSGSWPAGNSQVGEKRWSMQRGETPGDGMDVGNWYTCTPSVLQTDGTYTQMQGYWKSDSGTAIECGTPGQPNLSSNDPTKPGYADWLATKDSEEKDPPVEEPVGEETEENIENDTEEMGEQEQPEPDSTDSPNADLDEGGEQPVETEDELPTESETETTPEVTDDVSDPDSGEIENENVETDEPEGDDVAANTNDDSEATLQDAPDDSNSDPEETETTEEEESNEEIETTKEETALPTEEVKKEDTSTPEDDADATVEEDTSAEDASEPEPAETVDDSKIEQTTDPALGAEKTTQ